MTLAALVPISGHSVFLLLLQLALLLLVARTGAVLVRLVGQPAVIGELAAGIVLGPTVFGHYAPEAFAWVFPHDSAQFQLLEVVGLLGMALLLLLTGLETDLKLLKNLGRAAIVASILGMVVPFATGFGLGEWMPAEYLAQPDRRTLFAAFLATAMSISAMPVIAKILMDLDLTKRNIGLVILSAGVVDDTAGWLILSVIAGAATHGGAINLTGIGVTLALLAGFLVLAAFVLYPLVRVALKLVSTQTRMPDTDMVLILAVTFACAAVTEHIGVHAVFGAFICGTLLRQVPHLNEATIHRLESVVFSMLAPVFFGIVGLKVNLWSLEGGGMLGVVLAIACVGKLLGCTVGGLWGGMHFWEAFSIAVAMNARGAMGLVLATIGLGLGILNQQMFSIIVLVAIITSFMAPVGLRLTMRMVRMSDEEAKRILVQESKGLFDPERLRVLVPTAGGPNALVAASIAFQMAKRSQNAPEIVYVEAQSNWLEGILRRIGSTEARQGIDEHLAKLREMGASVNVKVRRLVGKSAARAIVEDAKKGFDMILVGASGRGEIIGGKVLEDMVVTAPCHVAIVKVGKSSPERIRRILVVNDGTTVARAAAELALRLAEATSAELIMVMLGEQRQAHEPLTGPIRSSRPDERVSVLGPPAELSPEEELLRISPVFRASDIKPTLRSLDYDPSHRAVVEEIERGGYDLVVVGAENRAVRNRMFFGYGTQQIIERSATTTIIVVPKIAVAR